MFGVGEAEAHHAHVNEVIEKGDFSAAHISAAHVEVIVSENIAVSDLCVSFERYRQIIHARLTQSGQQASIWLCVLQYSSQKFVLL